MLRAKPGAQVQLRRLIASSDRPTWLIQWQGDAHPGDRLLESGCTLLELGRDLGEAHFATPSGRRTLPWTRLE